MNLHLLGLPHTVTSPEFSHCAFTAKILKFPRMMLPLGYDIIHYGVEGADFGFEWKRTRSDGGGSLECVDVMSRDEQLKLLGHKGDDPTKFYSDDARTDSPLYAEFNKRLRRELSKRVVMDDLVLLPFGHAHHAALDGLSYKMVECGIGYPTLYDRAQFKIFESNAWMHYHQGKANRWGNNYEFVVPNYFDVNEWEVVPELLHDDQRNRVAFLGRICDEKGLQTILEVAKRRPDLQFSICGQGNPAPYLTSPNIAYAPPLTGKWRSAYLGQARAVIMPTVFTEPFAGVSVEAQLCGTPVLSTSYGAFTETIEDEVTGFRCHTLGDFLAALDRAPSLDRQYISDRARRLYGYDRVGKMYDRAFKQIADLSGEGWYSARSVFSLSQGLENGGQNGEAAGNGHGPQSGIRRPGRALSATSG